MQTSNSFRRVVPGSPYFFGILLVVLLGITFLFSLYLEFVNYALLQIGLSAKAASITLAGIVVGGFINVPIHRTRFSQVQLAEWTSFYYHLGDEPFPIGMLRGNTIAINIGGAVVPLLLASWLLLQLSVEPTFLIALFIASAVNVGICYRLGKIVRNVGVMLPGWVAPFVGAGMALVAFAHWFTALCGIRIRRGGDGAVHWRGLVEFEEDSESGCRNDVDWRSRPV